MRPVPVLPALLIALLGATAARAQYVWSGGVPASVNGNWSTSGNWSTAVPVSSQDTTITFGAVSGSARTSPVQNLGNPFTLNLLTFTGSAPAYSLSGSPLRFATGSGGASPGIDFNAGGLVNVGTDVQVAGPLAVQGGGAGTLTLAGALSGASQLTVSLTGTGAVRLDGANAALTGQVVLQSGLLQIGSDAALGTQALKMYATSAVQAAGGDRSLANGLALADITGTLTFGGTNNLTFGGLTDVGVVAKTLKLDLPELRLGPLSGSASVTKSGTGTLVLNGDGTAFTGGLTVTAGTARLGVGTALRNATVTVNAANGVDLNGLSQVAFGALAGSGTINQGVTANAVLTAGGNNRSTTFSGVLAGANTSLSKAGTGTLTLTGANTFGGNLSVDAGTVALGAGGSLAPGLTSLGNAAGGAGSFTQTGGTHAPTIYLIVGFAAGGSGTYALSAGSLASPTTFVGYAGTGTFAQAGGTHTGNGLTLGRNPGGDGTYNLTGGALTFGSLLVGQLGSGTFNQTGGTASVASLVIGLTAGQSGAVAVSGAGTTLSVTGGADFGAGQGSLTVAGGGAVAVGGTLTLAGPGGSVTVNGGTLSVDQLALGTGTGLRVYLTDPAGGTALTVGTGNSTSTLAAPLADGPGGAGGLRKVGTGTLTLSAANTFTGTAVVDAGVLRLGRSGALGFGASARVNAAGTLRLNGHTAVLAGLSGSGVVETAAAGVASLAVGDGDAAGTFAGTLRDGSSGTLSLTKAGSGMWTVTGTLSHTGGTTINEGTIQVGGSGVMYPGGAIAGPVQNAGTLRFVRADGNGQSYGGGLSGTGTLQVQSFNGSALVLSGTNTHTGPTDVQSGRLAAGSANAFSPYSAVLLGAPSTSGLALNGFDNAVGSLSNPTNGVNATVSNGGAAGATLTVGGDGTNTAFYGQIQNGGAGRLGLTKVGGGTLTLAGANTYTGTTTIKGGTLRLGLAQSGALLTPLPAGTRLLLDGGTLSTGAVAGLSAAAGVLDLGAADSVIALGAGDHALTFGGVAAERAGNGRLTVTGWAGGFGGSGTAGKLLFNGVGDAAAANAQYADFLSHVSFAQGSGTYGAAFVDSVYGTQLAPVPEPAAVLGLAAAGLALASRVRRRG